MFALECESEIKTLWWSTQDGRAGGRPVNLLAGRARFTSRVSKQLKEQSHSTASGFKRDENNFSTTRDEKSQTC